MDKSNSESSFSELEPADEELIIIAKPVVAPESITPEMSSSTSNTIFSPYEEPVDPVIIKNEPISQEIVEKLLTTNEIKKESPLPERSSGEIFVKQEPPSPEKDIETEPLFLSRDLKTEPVSRDVEIKVESTSPVNLQKTPNLGAVPKVRVKREQVLVDEEPTRNQVKGPSVVGSHVDVDFVPKKVIPKTGVARFKEEESEFSRDFDRLESTTINADQADVIEVVGEDTPLIAGSSADRMSGCLKFFDWMTGYYSAISGSDKWFFASNCLIIWIFIFIVITVCAVESTPKTASTISGYLVLTFSLLIIFVSALLYLCYRRISYRDNQENTRVHSPA